MADKRNADPAMVFNAIEKQLFLSKHLFWAGCCLVGSALTFLLLSSLFQNAWGDTLMLICLLLAITIWFISLIIRLAAHFRSSLFVKDNIFPRIAERYFESEFKNNVKLSGNTLEWLNYWVFPEYHEINYGESIQGIHNGHFLQITEVELIHITLVTKEVEKTDSNGNTYIETETREERSCVFKGPIYLMSQFPRKPSETVAIYSKVLRIGMGRWKTESIEFNKLFMGQSNDGHSFFKVFSPAFIDRILSLDNTVKRRLKMCFTPTGYVLMAIDTRQMRLSAASTNVIVRSQEDIDRFDNIYTQELNSIFQFLSQLDVYGI